MQVENTVNRHAWRAYIINVVNMAQFQVFPYACYGQLGDPILLELWTDRDICITIMQPRTACSQPRGTPSKHVFCNGSVLLQKAYE